jgi:hypothetical protein
MSQASEILSTIFHWISDPYNPYTRKIENYLNVADKPMPYEVVLPEGESLTIEYKYYTPVDTQIEYFYQVRGSITAIESVCYWISKTAHQPLRLPYLGDVDLMELKGLLAILPKACERVLHLSVDRVLYTRYSRPSYIEFTPLQRQLLPEKYDILKEYSYNRRPTLDVLSQVEKFEPLDTGNITTTPISASSSFMADVMSQLQIAEFVGYTLLAETPLVYLALKDWATQYDYDEERATSMLKRWQDMILVRVEEAYPESLLWDLRRRALYLESQGWMVVSETTLDLGGLDIYDEVAEAFRMSTAFVPYDLDLRFYRASDVLSTGYFSPHSWLEDSVARIYEGLTPLVRVTGEWTMTMSLEDTEIYKVAYAAQRSYATLSKSNPLLANSATELLVLPDLSIQVPVYDAEEQLQFTRQVEAILKQAQKLEGIRCKDLAHCQSALEKTKDKAPHTHLLVVFIGDQYALVSDGPLFTPSDAQEYQKYLARATKIDVSPPSVDMKPLKGQVVEISYPEQELKVVLQVQLPDGRQIDLLTLEKNSPTKDQIRKRVEDRWREGWFLTPWAKSQWQKTHRLSSYLLRNIQTSEAQKELTTIKTTPPEILQPRRLLPPIVDTLVRSKGGEASKRIQTRRKLLQGA